MKLIERYYKTELGHSIEEYLIDTDAELASLPKAPVGSYAISVESGKKFFINSSGEWPDPSKYVENGGGGGSKPEGTIHITENGTHDVTEYASAEVNIVYSGEGVPVETYNALKADFDGMIDGSIAEIESDVIEVGAYALNNLSTLISLNLPFAKKVNNYGVKDCKKLKTVNAPLVERLDNSAFYGCTALATADFPSVTYLGQDVFRGCIALTTADFPLAESAGSGSSFSGCTALATANFPSAIATGSYTFSGCTALATANFPLLKTISTQAFQNCNLLNVLVLKSETVVTLSSVSAFQNTPFRGYNGLRGTYYAPQALVEKYKTASNWSSIYAEGFCDFLPIEGSEYE